MIVLNFIDVLNSSRCFNISERKNEFVKQRFKKACHVRHHMQFNVVDDATLRQAQENPAAHRDLIVRVAGYSDYFVDLTPELQAEIIRRTEQSF